MKARGLILLLIVALGAAVAYWYFKVDGDAHLSPAASSSPTPAASAKFESKHGDAITVNAPRSGNIITSPLKVAGIVPGSWSFEADFPIEIADANHKKVGEGFGTVSGEWMTDEPRNFTATVKFKKPATDTGFVVIKKANPEGDESHEDSIEVPVRFG